MREFRFVADGELVGKEILTVLTSILGCSSNIVSKLKQGEYILVNGKQENVRYRLLENDELVINIPSEKSENIVSNGSVSFGILFEDEDILVVDKPFGIPTHPSIHHYDDTLANGVMAYINDEDFTFRAVNRLDRETSGIVLIAKNMLSAHILSKAVADRKIEKIYRAVTVGVPGDEKGEIIAPIAREMESIITRCVRDDGQYAHTEYEVLKKGDGIALLDVRPITGRTHQIRVHFSHIGYPLFGDVVYGEKIEGERTRLHCYKMSFYHPITKELIEIISELPDDFKKLFDLS